MKDKILKWWNRTWSNWEFSKANYIMIDTLFGMQEKAISICLKKISSDGLIEFKIVRKK